MYYFLLTIEIIIFNRTNKKIPLVFIRCHSIDENQNVCLNICDKAIIRFAVEHCNIVTLCTCEFAFLS